MKRLILILCLLASPLWAVQPDEVLDDPVLEERARAISAGLRCPVCQNESIDESHAEVARDLRLVVRERLLAGDSDAEVVAFVVDRYGEFVLLRPTLWGSNLLLWLTGPILLILGGVLGGTYLRRRSTATATAETALSPEEQARLDEILKS